ncbi:MAG: SpoIIE family protein phosphatase [Candidatus Aenigmarchaeota archaeon]|nr:SpoIIE family protein phosphatase [Candidatus Aenigmarchaeota archaeon]
MIKDWSQEELAKEVLNLQELSALALPRKENFPRLKGIDYFAATEPYKGCVGGDLVTIVNFEKEYHIGEKIKAAREAKNYILADTLAKNLDRFGILVADSSGHMISDSVNTSYLHAAFRTGVAYELKYKGEITAELFELLNTNFYNRMTPEFLRKKPFITLIYGEVSNSGKFRFLSAGHPAPIVFSNDGLSEQQGGELNFCDSRLEDVFRETKNETAKNIYRSIMKELQAFSPIEDDVTLAVIKKR